jgi:hypothetical protein
MKAGRRNRYARQVFINCPFDGEYLPLMRAIVFVLQSL